MERIMSIMTQSAAKVASVSQQKVTSRSLVVVAAILIQLCLGALYAWSVFTPQLTLPIANGGQFGFSKTQTQVIFSVCVAVFAVAMVLAGRWQAKSGPRIVAFTGGIVFGAGYILASIFGKSFMGQIIFIGIIGGAGIGLTYVCPVAVGMKWFPDRKGLITGLAVAGFGFGAVIWVKLAGSWGGLLESIGVLKVFLLYGVIFTAVVIFGSIWMVNPPEGWKPAGWKPEAEKKKGAAKSSRNLLPKEMLSHSQFYGLWIMFIFSSMAGLMVIGNIKLFGIEQLKTGGMAAVQASAVAGTAMAVFYSIANGLGRIIWGTISDKTGRKMALALMCSFQGIMMLIFYWMGGNQYLIYLAAAIIGFNFGGNFSLFPTMTADLFGTKNVGRNYGWVFTAYGVGGIIGPIMAGIMRDRLQNWLAAFVISGIACLVAAVVGLTLRAPKHHISEARHRISSKNLRLSSREEQPSWAD
jgi:OFA family oxalate/formate antiporter-like MFS transporter